MLTHVHSLSLTPPPHPLTPPHPSPSLPSSLTSHPVHQFYNDQLQDLVEWVHLVDAAAKVVQSPLLVHMEQHHEGIPLAGWILLALKVPLDQLGSIRESAAQSSCAWWTGWGVGKGATGWHLEGDDGTYYSAHSVSQTNMRLCSW